MYKVIKYFTDLKDDNYPYVAGDTFPRDGLEVSKERIIELATSNNRQKTPLITFIEDEAVKKALEETGNFGKDGSQNSDNGILKDETEKSKKPTIKKK